MKFAVERNWIDVLGIIWLPPVTAGLRIDLRDYDITNIGKPTRENVEQWLDKNTGDFQKILDFHAIVGETEIPWGKEESELEYYECFAHN